MSPAPTLGATGRTACTQLVARLPQRLQGAARRRTEPDPATTAAWGDPAITLVCGGPDGSGLAEPFVVDGIRWALYEGGGGRTWTTVGHRPGVQVMLPDAYQNQAELIALLSAPLLTPAS